MDLSSLHPNKGAVKSRKRVGRGIGSGRGGTSGRGHKGQNSRTGAGRPAGFEGGQMPLQRRLPKRGFTNVFKKQYALIQVGDLSSFEKDSIIDASVLLKCGLVKKIGDGIKLLGRGDIDHALNLKIHKWSQSAHAKITAAGGTIEGI
ncbi:MAG: 50S ribosomal protein L15 [Deltaproteobacteria bacterium]|nr:50S ribosomal protein L15 [Deltaproteobacteria bacterium]